MSTPARFSGICHDCGGTWVPGDPIRYQGTERLWENPRWCHAVCPDDPDDLTPRHPVCQDCWMEHPSEVECDSW